MADEPPPTYDDVAPQQGQPQYNEQPYYEQQPASQQPQQPVYYDQQPPSQQPQVVYVQQPVPAGQQPQQSQQPVYYAQQPPMQQQPVQQQYDPNQPQYDQNQPQQDNPPTAVDGGYGTSEFGERLDYNKPEYRDKVWAIVWVVHFVIMFVVLLASFGSSSVGTASSSSGFLIIFVCGATGVVMGYLWTVIIRRYGGVIIKFMMIATLIWMVISCIMSFATGNFLWGVIAIIFIVLFALYIRGVWNRIPFAACCIQIASDIIKLYPGTIWVALLMLGLQVIWTFIWGGVVAILLASSDVGGSYAVYFILLISLYWNLETFKNLAHCTVCGVAACWYFSPYPQEPTKGSLKRACTTSLGSVAFGSLLVSIIQATRAILRQAARSGDCNACLVCLIDCLLGCLERWVQFFNKYAFAHVAIYGEGFIASAKQTWQLLSSKGMDAWVNDDLVGFALVCGAMIGGFVCAALGGLMVFMSDALDNSYTSAYALLGFFIGFYLCWTVLNIVASCVVAIFVCFAEDPNAMEINRTNEYHKLTAARAGMDPSDFEEQQENEQQMNQQQYGDAEMR